MEVVSLGLKDIEKLLDLEGEMYWQGEKWRRLWQEEAKGKFRVFIQDYLTSFPQGCFGLVDNNEELLGSMFLIKLFELKPIPYLQKVSDYLEKDGRIAYVSLFVVKKGDNEEKIGQKLYDEAKEISLLKLKCKTMAVVIYSSPLEERILKVNNYEKLNERYEWEIYPGKKVFCWIYRYNFLMKQF